jgi:hypothetical protein
MHPLEKEHLESKEFEYFADFLINKVERLQAENEAILSSKQVILKVPALPESEVIRSLRSLLEQAQKDIHFLRSRSVCKSEYPCGQQALESEYEEFLANRK